MVEHFPFVYPVSEFLMTLLGLIFFFVDLVLDLKLVVSLYQEEAYHWMGVLIFLLLFSSLLVQLFSALWFYYDHQQTEENVVCSVRNRSALIPIHLALLAVPFRYIGILKASIRSFRDKDHFQEGMAVYLNHDLSMLRLFKTFSESAPQLVLMISIIIHKGQPGILTALKTVGSAAAIAFSVVMYHRNMRSFLPEKAKQSYASSVAYFIWNLLLIGPRVASVALYASVLPCYLAAHFLGLWLSLVIWAWLQGTDLMDSLAGEWLYRGTVALIWYFSWFSVSRGGTQGRSIIYHVFMLADTGMLLWFWWEQEGEPGKIFHMESHTFIATTLFFYTLGLVLKVVYYKYLHPSGTELHAESLPTQSSEDVVDFRMLMERSTAGSAAQDVGPLADERIRVNKRMKTLAANFYTSPTPSATAPSAGGFIATVVSNGLEQCS